MKKALQEFYSFFPEKRFAYGGLATLASLIVTLPLLSLDTRILDGENIWLKPIKFQISLGLYLLTLSFFSRWVNPEALDGKRYRIFSWAVVAACAIEMIWIAASAGFGIRSHYNDGAIMTIVYATMGVIVFVLLSACIVTAIMIIKRQRATGFTPMGLTIPISLILTFVLTTWSAGTLAEGLGPIWPQGTDPISNITLPILGWSMVAGDLKVSHFFATHAMHFVPLILWPIFALISVKTIGAILVIAITAKLYTALIATTYFQALNGIPFISYQIF